jgi:hypothetical protein
MIEHCRKHGTRLSLTTSRDIRGQVVHVFWTCPSCNAEILDEMAQRPDTFSITIQIMKNGVRI